MKDRYTKSGSAKMKRRYLLCLLMTGLIFNVFAQDGSGVITGSIVTEEGDPAAYVSLNLQEVGQKTRTNSDGQYEFTTLSSGKYTVSASLIGYKTMHKMVKLNTGDKLKIDFVLTPVNTSLQEVEITGRKESSYKNTSTFSGTRTETPIKFVPQAISYVTKEVIMDRQGFKNNEVVKNISGVNQSSYNNNGFVVRGFSTSNRLINGLRMGSSGWNQSSLPNMERVEVIKGPASALYANTSPGGTINSVTKKPLDEARKSVNFATGSYNTYRITSDFTGPMNEKKTLLYRLNLAYQNAGSFRILQDAEDIVVAPSVSFIPDDKTMVNFDIVYSATNGRLDRGQAIFGASAGTDLNSTPISFAIGKKSDYQKEYHLYSTLSFQRKITDQVTFNASYMKYMYNENLEEHRTSNTYAVDADGVEIPTLMAMQTIHRVGKNYTDNLNLYVNTNFNTGALEHKVVGGYDHISAVSPVGNSSYNARGYLTADGTGFILGYDPEKRDEYMIRDNMPVPNVPHFDLEHPDYSITDIANYINVSTPSTPTRYYLNGFYIQEQIKWGKFNALIALRQEYYSDMLNYQMADEQRVEQKALLPRFGLVYTPIEPISIYATYNEGYQPQSAGTIGDPERFGGPFEPLISNMIEGGIKTEFLRKRLVVNLAIYQIIQNNVLMNAGAADNPDLLRPIGQERARGIELDVYGEVNSNLSLTANFAYNKAVITESDRPEEIGSVFPNAPLTQGGFWAKYMFSDGMLKGLGFGLGSNYAGERFGSGVNRLPLPSYVVVDAAAYYSIDKFRLSFNLNNVFNKAYWIGGFDYNRLFPGTPRNFLLGVGYSF